MRATTNIGSTPFSTAYTAVSASPGAICTLTIAGSTNKTIVIKAIEVGYDQNPPVGCLVTITNSGSTVWRLPLTSAGMGPISICRESSLPGNTLAISLTAASGTILGYINASVDIRRE